jgi:AcrR family transcriptional regulator
MIRRHGIVLAALAVLVPGLAVAGVASASASTAGHTGASLAAASRPARPALKASGPITISGKSHVVIKGYKIRSATGNCITVTNSTDITIEDSQIGPCGTAGATVLAAGGPDAVRVETLAQALGVTKGGFYGHFADRNALLEEMLTTWERRATDEALGRVQRQGGDVRTRLRRAGVLTFSRELTPVDLAIRDWARRDPAVAERLRRVDNRRMEYLRTLFRALGDDEAEAEARSMLAFSLMIGHHFIAADLGARSHDEVLDLAGRWLLAPGRRDR